MGPSIRATTGVVLRSQHLEATIEPLEASLVALSRNGEELMPPYDPDIAVSRYHGAIIAPWPNRIADGQYSFAGQNYLLPLNEPSRKNALHGLSAQVEWSLDKRSDDSVDLSHRVGKQSGYPWEILLEARYSVTNRELCVRLEATNLSETPAPYGAAFHPYFALGDTERSRCLLYTPAHTVVIPDPDRLLPTADAPVANAGLDFSQGATPEREFLDHAFTGFSHGAHAILESPSGIHVEVKGDQESQWMQLHSPQSEGVYGHSVVIEPMTCPPDAFNSGRDVIVLGPHETHSLMWTISCRAPGASL